jgi:hypothetical protein
VVGFDLTRLANPAMKTYDILKMIQIAFEKYGSDILSRYYRRDFT